jgi:hypothetical protein
MPNEFLPRRRGPQKARAMTLPASPRRPPRAPAPHARPSRHLRKLAMTDIPAKVDETLAAFRQHMRLNNMPIPGEGFIRWVVGRMLQIVQDQPDLPEDTAILAQVHAILIEDALQESRNAPNRAVLIKASDNWSLVESVLRTAS